jgi:UDP:flavonoid glycosyltransferase YjiC (YdhE family)
VELLGVGPGPIPREKLTAAALANAIHIAVTNERMKRNAKDLGERIRAEDGIDRAVKLIEGDPAN